jgi:branched-chain amino acid transport system substrate-binding protein
MSRKLLPIILIFFLSACGRELPFSGGSDSAAQEDTLFQTSTISSLLQGDYDGDLTIAQLKQQGDFGLGTFNGLDGEMIVLDGIVYQVRSDGAALEAVGDEYTPFAAVTYFESEQSMPFEEPEPCTAFQETLDSVLPDPNAPYAIQVSGTFSEIQVRAPYKQHQPYPTLAEALEDQAVFNYENVQGTMVGFRLPDYLEGVNATGYHFHFLTEDMKAGGHVLDCRTGSVQVDLDGIEEILVDLQPLDVVPAAQPNAAAADVPAVGAQAEPVVLGAIYSLTGGQAGLDVPSAQGAQLAVDQANEDGGVLGREVQLVLQDGATDPQVIGRRSQEIIDEYPSVSALFGLSDTDLVEAAAAVTSEQERLFLTSGATSPKLPAVAPGYLFLACFGDNVQAAAGAEWVYNELGARSAAVLYIEGSTYTELLQGYFQTRFAELGGEIVNVQSYEFNADSQSGTIETAVQQLDTADLIYLAATPDDALPAVLALRAAGFDQPILGGDGLDVPTLWQNRDVSQVYFTTHAYLGEDNPDPQVTAFREAYLARYPDSTPDAFAALGYDAARLLMAAIADAGSSDPQAVRGALAQTQDFDGVTGTISYNDGQQIPSKSVSILNVTGGALSLVSDVLPQQVPAP